MAILEQRGWPLAWLPSDDAVNGRKNGLLRMDNCTLDEENAIVLTRGTSLVGSLGDTVNRIYSKVQVDGSKHRYVHLSGGSVLKDTGGGGFGQGVIGGGVSTAAFGSALGQVLACSGTQKKKDDGSTIRNLGIGKPTVKPTVALIAAATKEAMGYSGNWTLLEGTNFTNPDFFVQWDTQPDFPFRGVVAVTESMDLTDMGGTGKDLPDDTWKFDIRIGDTEKLISIRVEYVLSGTVANPDEYFYFQFNKEDEWFNSGINAWTTINIIRDGFIKAGQAGNKTWKDVIGIKVEAVATEAITILFDTMRFIGGTTGPLIGDYTYYQVNVYNTGKYLAKSPVGPLSDEITVRNQGVTVTPQNPSGIDNQVNEAWIYRRRVHEVPQDTWIRVKVLTSFGSFVDRLSDEDAEFANEQIDLFIDVIPDNIIDMIEGLYFDRQIYITADAVYPSKRFNIDAIDSRHVLKMSGASAEFNLWIRKVSNSSCLIGTTNDIYELSGTGQELADGTIDYILRPLGINQPPISQAATVANGLLFYISYDGWRALVGSSSERIVGPMDLLYEDYTRYGVLPVKIRAGNTVKYDIAFAKGKLWTAVGLSDDSRRLYAYDIEKRYWYPIFTDPVSLYAEEDGVLLGGYASALRILDTGTLLDGTTKQQINIRTVFDDNGQPRNRKDLSVLKVFADTGNDNVNLKLAIDGVDSFTDLGNFTFNGPTLRAIRLNDIAALNLKKSYQLQITDDAAAGVSSFRLFYWSIEYDPRPDQLNFLRLTPTNYGVAGRKRIYEIPLSIDTLGNDVTFTPEIDGVSIGGEGITINTSSKKTISITFATEQLGFEIGGTLQATGNTLFEFYELITPKQIEVLPDRTQFFRIPNTNLGTPARKRFVRLALVIDTLGSAVTFTPIVDGISLTTSSINTSRKQTFIHTFTVETVGTDVGGTLSGSSDFEYYGIDLENTVSEVLPPPVRFLRIPYTNLGSNSRKRIISVPIVIDTRGSNVTFTPDVDGVVQTALTVNTSRKQTVTYYFNLETTGVDIGGTLAGSNEFEFYGVVIEKAISEELPTPTKFLRIPNSNLGTDQRKRFIAYAISIDTRGFNVTFTPLIDGVSQASNTVNTSGKRTFIYYFLTETIGIDIGGTLATAEVGAGQEFEFYEVVEKETISEVLPGPAKFLRIPNNNLGTDSRKRFIAFAFVIDTQGVNVTFTPIIDGISQTTSIVNTSGKRTFIHYFTTETIGTDIGGALTGTNFFEFYGVNQDETVSEKMPGPTKFLVVPATNFGVPAKKRVRTIPMLINTRGSDVTYTPVIDGINGTPSTINTATKRTFLHYFTTDIFGVDFGAIFSGANPFEFYELLKPEAVEVLPVPKKFDQIGPFEFDRLAKIISIRLHLITGTATLDYTLYDQDTSIATGSIITTPNKELEYLIKFQKTTKAAVLRAEFLATVEFHRIEAEVRYNLSGGETGQKKIKISSKK